MCVCVCACACVCEREPLSLPPAFPSLLEMYTLIYPPPNNNTRTLLSQRPRPCLPRRRDTGRRRCAPDCAPVHHPVLSLLRGRHRGGHPSAEPAQYDGQSSHARRRRPVYGRRQVLLDVQPVQATPRKALQLLRQLRAAVRSLKGSG